MIVLAVGVLLSLFLWSRERRADSLIALGVIYVSIAGVWFPLGPLSRFALVFFCVGILLSYFIAMRGSATWKTRTYHSVTFVPIILSCLWSLSQYPFAGVLLVLVGISLLSTVVQIIKGTVEKPHRCLLVFPVAYALDRIALAF